MKNRLPEGYRSRPASMEDIDSTTEMFNAWSRQMLGVEKFKAEENAIQWQTPGFDLGRDTRLVLAEGGQVAGYCEVWDQGEPHVLLHCWGRVHPEHARRGLGTYLLNWAEERARQTVPLAPEMARVALNAFVLASDRAVQALLEWQGFNLVRHNLRMVIELDGLPAEPDWPVGMTVRTMVVGQDERDVYTAVRESFKDHWGYVERPFEDSFARWQHFWKNRSDFDPSLMFMAMEDGHVAGVSLCMPKVDDDPEMGWVATLGVRRAWRRRGVGLALLHHSFAEFFRRGVRKVGLGVDAENLTGAIRLYRKAGMHSDPDRQFSIYEKTLRPGVDLSTQDVQPEAVPETATT